MAPSAAARVAAIAFLAFHGTADHAAPKKAPSCSASPFKGLDPVAVWRHFNALCQLPRCSGHEGAVVDYVRSVAESQGAEWIMDSVGNVIVHRPPAEAAAAADPVTIHTHLDMTCARSSDGYEAATEPIEVTLRGDGWAVAEKSRMGADSGVGIAVALALLEEPLDTPFPPLELLFTVQGQSDRLGARSLNASFVSGRHLLNLDAAEHGVLFVGAAGRARMKVNLPVSHQPLREGTRAFVLSIAGLRGGHSGSQAQLGVANALVAVSRAAASLRAQFDGRLQVVGLEGGDKDDAIPSQARATLAFSLADLHAVREAVAAIERELHAEFGRTDPELHLRIEQPEHAVDQVLSDESAERLLDLILLLPNGVTRYSSEIPGSIETSNNIARVRWASSGLVEVLCLARSALPSALADLTSRIARTARRVVGTALVGPTFPGWAPNRTSPLLHIAQDAFRKVEGKAAMLEAVHSSLEVAAILEKLPHMDAVSFGPDVNSVRSPGECVRIDSVEKTWEMTKRMLARLAHASTDGSTGEVCYDDDGEPVDL
mmetsp:Transcript_66637/g.192493  ORF Transcript_66637/g.192493 Transcript_66637/m.192493 type:complete len:544 (-) Transcript_66637:73-1704(-)